MSESEMALERRIDELCRENEQLRQQVASIIGRSFRTADKMDCLNTENEKLRKELEAEHALAETLGHHHEYAQAENAKLRDLVRDVYTLHRNGLDCTECPWFDECNTTSGCPWLGIFANRMRELDILEREA